MGFLLIQVLAFSQIEVLVLGTAQDGGFPHAGCHKECCEMVANREVPGAYVASLAIVDLDKRKYWIIDCTPDFADQMRIVEDFEPYQSTEKAGLTLAGIFLTHAHIGHYIGLADLGREVMGADNIPVYVMPRMMAFLENNGPWDQLIRLDNIALHPIHHQESIEIPDFLTVKPFLVPHRDEYSETVGFEIIGPRKRLIYIPDIDKWERWETDIREVVKNSDYALLDATFYDEQGLSGRQMDSIPHPFVVESLEHFAKLKPKEKAKIHFTHMNHTNPLRYDPEKRTDIEEKGLQTVRQGQRFEL